jgi:hypothetical protein
LEACRARSLPEKGPFRGGRFFFTLGYVCVSNIYGRLVSLTHFSCFPAFDPMLKTIFHAAVVAIIFVTSSVLVSAQLTGNREGKIPRPQNRTHKKRRCNVQRPRDAVAD